MKCDRKQRANPLYNPMSTYMAAIKIALPISSKALGLAQW